MTTDHKPRSAVLSAGSIRRHGCRPANQQTSIPKPALISKIHHFITWIASESTAYKTKRNARTVSNSEHSHPCDRQVGTRSMVTPEREQREQREQREYCVLYGAHGCWRSDAVALRLVCWCKEQKWQSKHPPGGSNPRPHD